MTIEVSRVGETKNFSQFVFFHVDTHTHTCAHALKLKHAQIQKCTPLELGPKGLKTELEKFIENLSFSNISNYSKQAIAVRL